MRGAAPVRSPRSANGISAGRWWCSCPAPTSTASSTVIPTRPQHRWLPPIGWSACMTSWPTICRPGSDRSSGSFINPRCRSMAPRMPSRRTFDICVIGHLREEKDPFRAARAARAAPVASNLRIVHLGKPHNPAYAQEAMEEMAANPRYVWRDEVPRWQVRRTFARCHAMVMSSIMEGGANVVSEAVVAGGAGDRLRHSRKRRPARRRPSRPSILPATPMRWAPCSIAPRPNPASSTRCVAHGDARRDRFSPERERAAAWAALLGELTTR